MATPFQEFRQRLNLISQRVEEIHQKYQRYFQREERVPPQKEREAIEREMSQIQSREYPPFWQFHVNNVAHKLATYRSLWDKRMENFLEYGTIDGSKIQESRRRETVREIPEARSKNERSMKVGDLSSSETLRDLAESLWKDLDKSGVKIADPTVLERKVAQMVAPLQEKQSAESSLTISYEVENGKVKFKVRVGKGSPGSA